MMLYRNYLFAAKCAIVGGSVLKGGQDALATKVPDYFQTSPKLWAGQCRLISITTTRPRFLTRYRPDTDRTSSISCGD